MTASSTRIDDVVRRPSSRQSQRRLRMTSLPRPVATICALLLAVTSPAAQAQLYDITDLGDVAPASINASGVIVGYAPLSGSATGFRAFVLDNGVLTLLPTHVDIAQSSPPEASFMRAYDVNKRGQVVGLAVVPSTNIGGVWGSGEVVAFLYEKGKTTFFAFPEGGVNHSSAYAISDKGLVAGLVYTPNPRGVLYDLKTGQQTTLSPLGGETAFSISINDVNDAGVAVGGSNLNAEEYHAFRYMARDGSLEDLGTLGGNVSFANAINDRGTIVGVSTTTVTNRTLCCGRTTSCTTSGPWAALRERRMGSTRQELWSACQASRAVLNTPSSRSAEAWSTSICSCRPAATGNCWGHLASMTLVR